MDASLNGPFGRIDLASDTLTIGRIPDNKLVLNDQKTSSRHAEIRLAGNGYTITDMGSTNGTFVNEQQLRPHEPRPLNNGDMIRIGETRFSYESGTLPQVNPTEYAQQGGNPAYDPTVAVPPPASANTAYGLGQQINPSYAQNPPVQQPDYGQQAAYPPPAYGQPSTYPPQQAPVYGQPYAAPPYGYPPPVQPKKSNRTLFIILGSIIGGIVLLCILGAIILYAARSTPEKTLTTYCNALKSGDYQTAYEQLSRTIQNQESEAQFAAALANGTVKITGCSVSNVHDDSVIGTGTLTYTTSANVNVVGDCRLAQEDSVWKITNQTIRQ